MSYDVIIYIETKLQNLIAKYLIDTNFKNDNVLIIAPKSFIKESVSNVSFYKSTVNLHGYSKAIPSLISLILSKKPKLICDLFICSFMTGLNSIYWESIIKYKNLGLIDDGTGTIYNLEFKRDFENKRIENIFTYYNVLSLVGIVKRLETKQKLKSILSVYFSIYYNEFESLNVEHLPIFNAKSSSENVDEILFIGQPFVEANHVQFNDYLDRLKTISNYFHSYLTYVTHPQEKENKFEGIDFIKIKKLNCTVEEYVETSKPKTIIGFTSSALINLSLRYGNNGIYYCQMPVNNYPDIENYYKLLEKFGIQKLRIPKNYV